MSFDPTDYLVINYDEIKNIQDDTLKRILPFADSSLYQTRILTAKQLTAGLDVKQTYDVSLDLQNVDKIEHEFEPGDTIAILPENDLQEVTNILNRLNLLPVSELSYFIQIRKETTKKKPIIPAHIPTRGTLLELFIKNLDLRSPPKKLFLKMLTRFTTCEQEVSKLRHLCSPNGSEAYNNFIKDCKSFLCLLSTFPSCNPPITRLLEHLGPLQPRPYSISSSPLQMPKELHFAFSVIEIDNDLKGICSSWLQKLIQKNFKKKQSLTSQFEQINLSTDNLQFYFRRTNNFRLPENSSLPIIMIGPGTGVAPFIGFLQHRALERKYQHKAHSCSWLFYGCRYLERDFLYKAQIDQFLNEGILTNLFCCSSRDKSGKVYVQDLIKANSNSFVDKIVQENAIVYVCGDAKNMAKQVRDTITNCLVDVMGWSLSNADDYIKEMVKTNRYIQDIWI